MQILTEHSAEILAAFWVTIKLTVYAAVGALILGTGSSANDIAEAYRTGRGSLKVRSRWTIEDLAREVRSM